MTKTITETNEVEVNGRTYYGIQRWFGWGPSQKEDSEILPGAVSSYMYMTYEIKLMSRNGPGSDNDYLYVNKLLPENRNYSDSAGIFIGPAGAISNAYDLSKVSPEDEEQVTNAIISKAKNEYPDYEFVLVPGEFPQYIERVIKDEKTGAIYCKPKAVMSTHILYIKDYKKHFGKPQVRRR